MVDMGFDGNVTEEREVQQHEVTYCAYERPLKCFDSYGRIAYSSPIFATNLRQVEYLWPHTGDSTTEQPMLL